MNPSFKLDGARFTQQGQVYVRMWSSEQGQDLGGQQLTLKRIAPGQPPIEMSKLSQVTAMYNHRPLSHNKT